MINRILCVPAEEINAAREQDVRKKAGKRRKEGRREGKGIGGGRIT